MISVSQATRLSGSFASAASRTESEIWSAILSGWPSVTDSDVNRNVRCDIATQGSANARRRPALRPRPVLDPVGAGRCEAARSCGEIRCERRAGQPASCSSPGRPALTSRYAQAEVRGGSPSARAPSLPHATSVGVVGDHERAVGAAVVEVESAEVDDLQRYAVEHRRLGRRRGRVEVAHELPGGSRACRRARAASPSAPAPRARVHDTGTRRRCRQIGGPQPEAALQRRPERERARTPTRRCGSRRRATASAGIRLASGCAASDAGAAGCSLGDFACRRAAWQRASATGARRRRRPAAGRYQAASARWRFACRTAATDAAWCENRSSHGRSRVAMPARSSAFVSAWRTIATAVRPDGSSTAICAPPPVTARASASRRTRRGPSGSARAHAARAPDCRREARTSRAARRRQPSRPAWCRRRRLTPAAPPRRGRGRVSLAGRPPSHQRREQLVERHAVEHGADPSVIGSSTPIRRERSCSTGAVVSPSTTWPISAPRLFDGHTCAISSPARRLRPDGCQQLTIRSPMPASPENVSGSRRALRRADPSRPARA